ncbi:MAG: sigma 54-interacting transcriptional regulator, partial [Balneolaceae bacterium]
MQQNNINEDLALRKILEGTSSYTGDEFFQALVRNLAEVLNTKGAWVAEFHESKQRLVALSFFLDDELIEGYEYEIKGTPCELAIEKKQVLHIPENVIELYPDDPDLKSLNAMSYLGAPLLDQDGTILGQLAVLDSRPMPEMARNLDIFRIFASRAASELRRIRAERQLRQHEEQLSRLFDSAMDAIVEVNTELSVIQANRAATELFEGNANRNMLGHSFERYISPDSARKLKNLLRGLQNRPGDSRALWVPGGFIAVNHTGEEFQTEATLSCYEHNRKVYFNLVFRNVSDRIEAEKRIDILSAQTEYLQEEIRQMHHIDEMIGESEAMQKVRDDICQVASTDATVLVIGETGTGKELVARCIHMNSRRKNKPLVKVNCAAIPASLIESEFFGHEEGAFTGATKKRKGRFALADGGTIFLDEIGELPLELQSKLLRVLQEGEFEPVGSSKTQKVNVRIISATNRDLKKMIEEDKFREDLYYRLNVFPIQVPPLRERDDDVIVIALTFIKQFSKQSGRHLNPLSPTEIQILKSYHWPGNIRELRNIIERAVITSKNKTLNLGDLLSGGNSPTGKLSA